MAPLERHLELHPLARRDFRVLAVVADRFQRGWLEGLVESPAIAAQADRASVTADSGLAEMSSPVEALEYADGRRFDVCFLDDRFGERAVLRFLHTLRAWGSPFPTIVLAAANNEELIARALDAGAADYLLRGQTGAATVHRSVRYALEHQALQSERRAWKQRYRALFERSLAGTYRLTADGTVLACNHALARLLGAEAKEDIQGRHLLQTRPDSEAEPAPLERPDGRSFLARDVCLLDSAGQPLWVRMSDTLTSQPGGGDDEPVFEGTMVETSRARELEALVRQREAQFVALFQAVGEAMLVVDGDGRVKACNRQAEQLLGLTATEVVDRELECCVDCLFDQNRQPMTTEEMVAAGTLIALDNEGDRLVGFRRLDGKEGWVAVHAAAVEVPGAEEHSSLILTLMDLSQLKSLESRLLRAQKMEVVGRLAGGLAHEFRNLLTAISGYSELLLNGSELTDDSRASGEEIRRASKRATALANQMLHFSRRADVTLEPLDLDQVVEQLSTLIRRLVGGRVVLGVEKRSGGWQVNADRGQVEQVLLNLVLNARDAMSDGGSLRLRTEQHTLEKESRVGETTLEPGSYVVLSTIDSGTGMDDATRERAFEAFYTTKAPDKGTGLGLPTVREIVRSYGGEVRLESEIGVGTTVSLFLPVIRTP